MIINIRGTSGSGKTTIVRTALEQYPVCEPYYIEGRKRPLGYWCSGHDLLNDMFVVGHYETPCGGCDTITKYETTFGLIRDVVNLEGCHVLYEGLLLAADVKRTSALYADGYEMTIIALNTPLETCLDSINARRQTRNPDLPPVNPKNTESKHRSVEKSIDKLSDIGLDCHVVNRQKALGLTFELLSQ